ncbi:serine hydrolase domain-containing protein [Kitasatospora cineracea]|uniref:CubicO group peptidase (Beta-lactamase class C family) n=1 Tax=Kitasatospora cineracea TaxID=88074 RepID=A0A8G1URG9_9ACTN|nr:serine hydrolase domain-containing protein [Kitasatospora cineracea]ROR46479.1 CubicO group peptidase (beta-lactamase class C family) [Kitasatospora cineracea]
MTPSTDRIQQLLADGVRDRAYPGAVWAVGNAAGFQVGGAVGVLDPACPDTPMLPDTVFDVASLTKILAVWSTAGTLWEDGLLPLDEPLGAFWPEVTGHPLGRATARNLLAHTAGLPLRAQLKNLYGTDPAAVREGVLHEALHRRPGEAVDYTDRAALVLGYLAEHLSGHPLDRLAAERIWQPLGMDSTRFGPLPADRAALSAPTEFDEETGRHLRGTAHDFSARLLNGVCGIAGVFSTADDLARFLRHLLTPSPTGQAGFGPTWVKESLTVHTGELTPARGLFWHPAPGTDPADDTWVHYGFTGTGMWISPSRETWAVLLTNKLYYTRDRQPLTGIRNAFRELAFDERPIQT